MRLQPEARFYPALAEYLAEVEALDACIPLGGSRFGERWGTPDAVGCNWSVSRDAGAVSADGGDGPDCEPADPPDGGKLPPPQDGPIARIVAAELKLNCDWLVLGFGQCCAYRLFAQRAYLAAPNSAPYHQLARLELLCEGAGIGLLAFDPRDDARPAFALRLRAADGVPERKERLIKSAWLEGLLRRRGLRRSAPGALPAAPTL